MIDANGMIKPQRLLRVMAYSSLVAAVACSPERTIESKAGGVKTAVVRNDQNTQSQETDDDKLAALGKQVPGFAGFYFDNQGSLHVQMTRLDDQQGVRRELDTYLRQSHLATGPRDQRRPATGSDLQINQVKYDFVTLKQWYDQAWNAIWASKGTVKTDIKERENRIRVAVRDAAYIPELEEILLSAGVPRDAFLVSTGSVPALMIGTGEKSNRNTEQPSATSYAADTTVAASGSALLATESVHDRSRAIRGGLKIDFPDTFNQCTGSYCYCTIGFPVRFSWVPDDEYFVTAGHCSDTTFSGSDGAPYWQTAGGVSNDYVGYEIWSFPTFTGGLCPNGRTCAWGDATVSTSTNDAFGKIVRPTDLYNGTTTVHTYATANFYVVDDYSTPPIEGMPILKFGATAGARGGEVEDWCVAVEHPSGVKLLCQGVIVGDEIVDGGDSGGPIYDICQDCDPYDPYAIILHGTLWGAILEFSAPYDTMYVNGIGSLKGNYGFTTH